MLRHRAAAVFAAAAAVFGGSAASAQTTFTTFVAVGDSLAAGFSNNSLVESHQRVSVPALLAAAAANTDFQLPLISEPGIPAELQLVSLVPAPVIRPKASGTGAPINLGLNRPYNNLAVPGATSVDALTRTADSGGFHDVILRGRGTQVQQAVSLRPTAVLLWIGNNDVLGAAIRGRAVAGVTLTPTDVFRTTYTQIVAALKNTGAFVVAANLPDVTTIPFVTTIRPFLTDPNTGQPVLVNGQRVALLGPTGPLPATAFVTLAASTLLAQGVGIPTAFGGTGTALPDEVILDPAEVAVIRDYVSANNQAIREICGAAQVPVLDIHALLGEVAGTGRYVAGVTLTAAFLSGGVFSYDGVHPTDLGYAVVANEWIRVINANGGSLPPVNLGPYLGAATAAASAGVSAQAFGGARGTNEVEFTEEAYRRLLAVFPEVNR
jgi:lysophospholipase L1-like esterase